MSKGTISRDNVHLGINIVNVEKTVLSTSCRSYHEEFIDKVNAHPANLYSVSHPHPITLLNRIVQRTGLSWP